MDEIRKQISRAHRRLLLEQFLKVFGWSVFGALLVAVVALAIPKFFPLKFSGSVWNYSWLGGALAAGVLLSVILTILGRRSRMHAAIELDRRFGLKERVSSTLALGESDLSSEAGQALLTDAERRVSRIDVRERFQINPGLRSLLPLIPAVIVFALFLVKDAAQEEVAAATSVDPVARKRVQSAVESIEERLKQRQKEAAESGLKEASELMKQVSDGLNKLKTDEKMNQEKALIKLSELSKELEKRQGQLGGTEKLRQQLSQLKNMEKGPADKVSKAIKEGYFKKAMEAMKDLKKQLQEGKLSEENQKELANQLDQMKEKLQQMAEAHEQAKQDLEQQIKDKLKNGDLAGAGKLQRQLDQMNQQNEQMAKVSEMAQKMADAAQALKEGNQQQAAQQLQEMAQDLQQMQNQLDELQMVEAAMDEILDAKNAMCEGQDGQGDMGFDMGMGQGMGQGDQPGMGMGEGQGQGDRPEDRTDTAGYRSRVAQNVQKGEVVRSGFANGPNMAGQSQESVKEEILSSKPEGADPIDTTRLPRTEREHLREYFQGFVDE